MSEAKKEKNKERERFKNSLENIELKKEMKIYLKYELRTKKNFFHIEKK